MTTKSLQPTALQDLREQAVLVHKTLADEAKRIKKLLSSHLYPRSHSHITNAYSHFSNSQAETTITQHSDTSLSIDLSKSLVVKQDGKIYPRKGYVSKYSDDFFVCLGCGSGTHLFRECKDQRDRAVCTVYWQKLWAHVSKTREKPSPPFIATVSAQSITSHTSLTPNPLAIKHGMGRGSYMNKPAWQTSDKRPHFFTITVLLSNISSPNQKLVPIPVIQIIHDNWDSFYEVRTARPMIDFEFYIDTGDAKAVCCRQPTYGIHKGKIMTEHISQLENNKWIRDCVGPLGALLFLAAKPHPESCVDIDKCVWRLCVCNRPLNSGARSFEFPIPRCSDSIEDLGDSYGSLFSISFDARSGYHQIKARPCD